MRVPALKIGDLFVHGTSRCSVVGSSPDRPLA
jgi:hypothetical protein